jgi:hypothetical protein
LDGIVGLVLIIILNHQLSVGDVSRHVLEVRHVLGVCQDVVAMHSLDSVSYSTSFLQLVHSLIQENLHFLQIVKHLRLLT